MARFNVKLLCEPITPLLLRVFAWSVKPCVFEESAAEGEEENPEEKEHLKELQELEKLEKLDTQNEVEDI